MIIFLSISFNMCFGCSKELSHRDSSNEYPKHMFWLRNKKNNFQLRTLVWGPVSLSHSYKNMKSFSPCITPCFWKTPKRLLLQTVKTQMKCSIMLHFIRVYTFCKGMKNLQTKQCNMFNENYNLTPLDMYNGLSHIFFVSNKKE